MYSAKMCIVTMQVEVMHILHGLLNTYKHTNTQTHTHTNTLTHIHTQTLTQHTHTLIIQFHTKIRHKNLKTVCSYLYGLLNT